MATRELSNGTRTVERWTNEGTPGYYTGTPLVKQRDLTTAEAADLAAMDAANTQAGNAATLQSRAQAALTANGTFQGLARPTTSMTLAQQGQLWDQVQLLTREVNALVRLVLGQLDSTSGT